MLREVSDSCDNKRRLASECHPFSAVLISPLCCDRLRCVSDGRGYVSDGLSATCVIGNLPGSCCLPEEMRVCLYVHLRVIRERSSQETGCGCVWRFILCRNNSRMSLTMGNIYVKIIICLRDLFKMIAKGLV